MEDLLKSIDEKIEAFKADSSLHSEKGNKSAGARARKTSLELTDLLKKYRKDSIASDK